MKNPFKFYEPTDEKDFVIKEENKPNDKKEKFVISKKLDDNKKYFEKQLNAEKNDDMVFRKIEMKGKRKGLVIFIDGMTDTDSIDNNIINSLLMLPELIDDKIEVQKNEILEKFITHNQASVKNNPDDIVTEVNFGCCAVFIDGVDVCFLMDVRQWEHRGISKPDNEQSIYGPQEAFSEMLRTNSALVRKILKTNKLICEKIEVGTVSKTRGIIMYIEGISNKSLVDEVRKRLIGIAVDYIISIEEVGLLIEDNKFSLSNQTLTTERPDRTAKFLSDGRVALILNGSPKAMIFPTNVFELSHVISDSYMKPAYANFTRIIRMISMAFSVLLPGLYLAATLFHHETIPTYLIYSISASRENVPFPSVVELLLMDIAFEMIREAGLRMPGTIGQTLGIVGGLILGQAAVSAKIVSPIMIIIIAITGIGSFATTNYSLSFAFRILRFAFIFLGSTLGLFGIGIGIFVYLAYLATLKNFGIPFLTPLPNKGMLKFRNNIFVEQIWKNEKRPEFLKPIDEKREPKISRKWIFDDSKEE